MKNLNIQFGLVILFVIINSLSLKALAADKKQTRTVKSEIIKFLQYTEVENKSITVGQFFEKSKNILRLQYREAFSGWLEKNKNKMMSKPVVSFSKDKDGTENVELRFGDSSLPSLYIQAKGESINFKIGKHKLSWRDLMEASPALNTLGFAGTFHTVVPSYKTYNHMTALQRAEYFSKLNNLLVAASAAQNKMTGPKKSSGIILPNSIKLPLLLSEATPAHAQSNSSPTPEKRCYVPTGFVYYEKDGQCVANPNQVPSILSPLASKCSSQKKNLCNPFFYGLENNEARCEAANASTNTAPCGLLRKTPADFTALVQNLAQTSSKLKGKPLLADGKAVDQNAYNLLKDEILEPMQSYLDEVITQCKTQKNNTSCDSLSENRRAFSDWIQSLKPVDENKIAAATPADTPFTLEQASPYLLAAGAGVMIGLLVNNNNNDDDSTQYNCPPGQHLVTWWSNVPHCVTDTPPLCTSNSGPVVANSSEPTSTSSYGCFIPNPPVLKPLPEPVPSTTTR